MRWVNGHWELLYGGAVPAKEGALAELRLDASDIEDAQFLKAVSKKTNVKILDEGVELRVALTIKEALDAEKGKYVLAPNATKHSNTAKISSTSRFVSIWLGSPTDTQQKRNETRGGLWLSLEGMEPRYLEASMIQLPNVAGLERAESLNHAFTLLSEQFETWRQAHTGSIYERVFYQEGQCWYPLDDLRNRAIVSAERTLIADLWRRIEEELGLMFIR
ncbi:MAG: hypothetical protein ABIU96_10385 [Rhodanobacter sp.]